MQIWAQESENSANSLGNTFQLLVSSAFYRQELCLKILIWSFKSSREQKMASDWQTDVNRSSLPTFPLLLLKEALLNWEVWQGWISREKQKLLSQTISLLLSISVLGLTTVKHFWNISQPWKLKKTKVSSQVYHN